MQRRLAVVLIGTALTTVACGPGRQAAWEKQAAQEQKAPSPAATAEAPAADGDLAAQALDAWSKRETRAELEKAISHWERALAASPDNAELLAHLTRAYYLLGDGYMRTAGEKDKMLPTLDRGVEYGERAMMAISAPFAAHVKADGKPEEGVKLIGKEGIEAMYWYASNLGKFAAEKGFTTQVFYKDRIIAVMQHVLSLDEAFFYAAPHRYFGAFYAKAPSFAGGDMEKSKQHFDVALAKAPDYLGTKVLYAEMYAAKAGDKELFQKLLGEVKSADPAIIPELVAEQKLEQKKAEQLLARTDELF